MSDFQTIYGKGLFLFFFYHRLIVIKANLEGEKDTK